MLVDWKNHIVSDPEILRGKPRLKGTRIPVGLVLGYLADGKTVDVIVAEFPDLTRDQIAACLDYARELAEFAMEHYRGKLIVVESGSRPRSPVRAFVVAADDPVRIEDAELRRGVLRNASESHPYL